MWLRRLIDANDNLYIFTVNHIIMQKYCLSYDAIHSEDWQGDQLKEAIVYELMTHGAINLSNPVASTILFEENANNANLITWSKVIDDEFVGKIYYYLCMVHKYKSGDYIEKNKGDKALENNFAELVKRVRRKISAR